MRIAWTADIPPNINEIWVLDSDEVRAMKVTSLTEAFRPRVM